jgi:hypothetical protein
MTNLSNDRIRRLTELLNNNEASIKEFNYQEDKDEDLMDFKFSINDKVKVE